MANKSDRQDKLRKLEMAMKYQYQRKPSGEIKSDIKLPENYPHHLRDPSDAIKIMEAMESRK